MKRKITHLKPSNRRPTCPTILGFIGSYGDGWMNVIIISKLYQRKMLIPISIEIIDTSAKNILKVLNSTFRLTIFLGMKAVFKFTLVPSPLWNVLQNINLNSAPQSKWWIRNTMATHTLIHEDPSIIFSLISRHDKNKVSVLGQAIHNYRYRIIWLLSQK